MATVTKNKKQDVQITDYKFIKGWLGSKVELKLPCMRKADEFCIYNFTDESKYIYFQGSGKCFAINLENKSIYYSNKGNAPMDYYLTFRRTHEFNLLNADEFIKAVKEFVRADSRNKADGTTVATICGY